MGIGERIADNIVERQANKKQKEQEEKDKKEATSKTDERLRHVGRGLNKVVEHETEAAKSRKTVRLGGHETSKSSKRKVVEMVGVGAVEKASTGILNMLSTPEQRKDIAKRVTDVIKWALKALRVPPEYLQDEKFMSALKFYAFTSVFDALVPAAMGSDSITDFIVARGVKGALGPFLGFDKVPIHPLWHEAPTLAINLALTAADVGTGAAESTIGAFNNSAGFVFLQEFGRVTIERVFKRHNNAKAERTNKVREEAGLERKPKKVEPEIATEQQVADYDNIDFGIEQGLENMAAQSGQRAQPEGRKQPEQQVKR